MIFKYHDDEACGVDGVLRADAKAAAAAEKKAEVTAYGVHEDRSYRY